MTVALVWITTVEGLLGFVARDREVAPRRRRERAHRNGDAKGGLLPIWGGALLFAAYGLAFAVAGSRLVLRRDIA